MVLILAIGAGCSGSPGIEQLSGSGSNSQQGTGGGTQQITGGEGGFIDSSGTVYPALPSNNAAGSAESSQPGGNMVQPTDWITYTDQQLGFSIGYPKIYVILDEIEKLTNVSPDLVGRVRFMDADLAKGPTANLEIPAFSIEIYANQSVIPLDSWISSNTPSGSLEAIEVDGVQCTQVSLMTLQAPNQFVFCSRNNYVYKFTPAGQYSQEMLDSFKFGN